MTAMQTSGFSGLTAQRIQTAALQSVRLVCGVFATALMLAQPVSPAAAQLSELRPSAYVRSSRTGKWGAGLGLGLGLFNIGFSDCSGTHCETSDNVTGVAAFTAIRAGVGALVGTVVRAERWKRVELPPRVDGPAVATTAWPPPL